MIRRRGDAGFTLVELVVSAAILCAVTVVLLQLTVAAQQAAGSQGAVADVQQRLRVAADSMYRDLAMAGAGPSQGAARGPLSAWFAPILPARTGARNADPELSYGADRISIVYVPDAASQTTLAVDMSAPDAPLVLDTSPPGCPSDAACGFAPGDRALVFDESGSGAYDIFTVASAGGGQVAPAPGSPLSTVYRRGSPVVAVVHRVYVFDRADRRIVLYDGAQTEGPLIDHVADLRFTYFGAPAGEPLARPLSPAELTDGPARGAAASRYDADLLTVRRVRVMVALETPGLLTGPDARLRRSQVTFDVAPRNMRIGGGS